MHIFSHDCDRFSRYAVFHWSPCLNKKPIMARRGERQPKPLLDDKTHPESLGTLQVAFLQRLRDRDYAESTVNQRRSYLNDFIESAEDRSRSRPTELTREVLERYQRQLAGRRTMADKPMSFRTQCGHLSALRAWFRWLVRYQHS